MGLFFKEPGAKAVQAQGDLVDLAKSLQDSIDNLANKSESVRLTRKTTQLKETLVELEIQQKKKEEDWAREKREIEHKVGLQKTRGEQELELEKEKAANEHAAAVKEAELAVRESHMDDKEKMFEERIKALTKGLEDQIEYLHSSIVKELMKRLPIFNVDTTLNPHAVQLPAGDDDVVPPRAKKPSDK